MSLRTVIIAATLAVDILAPGSPQSATGDTILVWKIGSPWRGEIPAATVPSHFRGAARRLGFGVAVATFPASGFAARFADAVARNTAPDVIVFDNFGIMNGITTPLGRFDGIGQDPTRRAQLIRVTEAFDEWLGPSRGWTYLFTLSRHYEAASTLALSLRQCQDNTAAVALGGEFADIVSTTARAYLAHDPIDVQRHADLERLSIGMPSRAPARVDGVRMCGHWGNDKFAVAVVDGTYQSDEAIGHPRVVLVLRKPGSHWHVLVVARDPISTTEFVDRIREIADRLSPHASGRGLPIPVSVLAPPAGQYPEPAAGQRFGDFVWRSSPSEDVVAEVAEFAYSDDTRLIAMPPTPPAARVRLSAGQLVSGASWRWRVWSISQTGDVVLSDVRTFVH